MKSRTHAAIVLTFLLSAAFLVRIYGNGLAALRSDESFSWRVSTRPFVDMLRDVAGDTHPPGHFILLKSWQGVFGTSLIALRSLSAACGALTALAVYLSVIVALLGWSAGGQSLARRARSIARGRVELVVRSAALFAGVLVATHSGLVGAGQSARMYALAAAMAAVSALAMLRAFEADPKSRRWWWIYGVCVAGLLYSHHYGWFTLAAQVLFTMGVVASRAARNWRDGLATAGGLLAALGLAAALYSPWLSVFLSQVKRVHEGFWVPAASTHETWWLFLKWLTGVDYLTPTERWVCVGSLGVSVAWRVWRRDSAAMFFLLQAILPWAATIAISTWGGRPLLQDRYLIPAQVALIGYLAVVAARICRDPSEGRAEGTTSCADETASTVHWDGGTASAASTTMDSGDAEAAPGTSNTVAVPKAACSTLPNADAREHSEPSGFRVGVAAAWVWFWCWLFGYGCLLYVGALPRHTPPVARAAHWLQREYRPGDRILTSSAVDLNTLRYYCSRAGLSEPDIRCPFSPFEARGQQVHVSSLCADDVMVDRADVPDTVRRLWLTNFIEPSPGWRHVRSRTFDKQRPPNGGPYTLQLFVRNHPVPK